MVEMNGGKVAVSGGREDEKVGIGGKNKNRERIIL